MPRELVIGNGNMLVTFDSQYHIRDFYYPYVGQENHTAGHYFRMGVWVDGQFSWVHDADWQRDLRYEPHTLVTSVHLRNPRLALSIHVHDTVDFAETILLRNFEIENEKATAREVRLFFSHDFHIYGIDVGDTAFYDPLAKAVIHYKRERYFLIGGQQGQDMGLEGWATGVKEVHGNEGTWRDAEDGVLECNPIAQGSVDSSVSLQAMVPPLNKADLTYWVCVGKTLRDVHRLHGLVQFKSSESMMKRTEAYWRLWAEKEDFDFPGLPQEVVQSFYQSLLILRTQIDSKGGIIAANDSDIMHYSRDTYSYVWPRDGAWVAVALDQAGYGDLSVRFFDFCHDVMEPHGYLMQKYNPDRSLASSWHPWLQQESPALPIQEDSTGIVVWALWQHFAMFRDVEVIKPYFRKLVVEAGNFLNHYRHPKSRLPLESWDLWEERRGVHAYTVATVYGGLIAASRFCGAFGEEVLQQTFLEGAMQVQDAFLEQFYDPELGVFVRQLTSDGENYVRDTIPDSSLLLLPRFGLVKADDPMMIRTAQWLREELWVATGVGGFARYKQDYYQRIAPVDADIPGNPWFVCTLWYADFLLMRAEGQQDLQEVADLLSWVVDHALPSGVLAEQMDPFNGSPVSVSPLTWSHSTLVSLLLRYRDKVKLLEEKLVLPRTGAADERARFPQVGQ